MYYIVCNNLVLVYGNITHEALLLLMINKYFETRNFLYEFSVKGRQHAHGRNSQKENIEVETNNSIIKIYV